MFDLYRKMEYNGGCYWEKIHPADSFAAFVDGCTPEELKHFRAVINGKLSKRGITPAQQAKMQAARQKVI